MSTTLMIVVVVLMMGVAGAMPGIASGAVAWRLDAVANTTVAPGNTLTYYVALANTGDTGTDGVTAYTVSAHLPTGLTGDAASGGGDWACTPAATDVTCTNTDFLGSYSADNTLKIRVDVDPAAHGQLTTTFDVKDDDVTIPPASTIAPVEITSVVPGFGVSAFDGGATDALGGPFTQAGGHPFAVSTFIDFNRIENADVNRGDTWPAEPPKDIFVDLPAGFIVNPTVTGGVLCTTAQLANSVSITAKPLCPPVSQVGVTRVITNTGGITQPIPVYNMVPPSNAPARFGFNVAGTVVTLDGSVRSGGDYGLSANIKDISEGVPISGASLILWGVPADPIHRAERGCPGVASPWDPSDPGITCATDAPLKPLLRNPTFCTEAGVGLATILRTDSWFHPGAFVTTKFVSHSLPAYPSPASDWGAAQGTTGCDVVPFDPTLTAPPTGLGRVHEPSGWAFDVRLPQADSVATISEADLKTAVVTLPEGVRVNPSSADGLQGCSQDQFALRSNTEPTCPDASKLGTMEIDSPLLDTPLTGSVYLARPFDNPFGSLLAVYLVASAKGVVIKVPGEVRTDPVTGQITATFDNNPQLPFTRVHMVFNSGPRAPLTLPSTCGPHTIHAVFTGWNGKVVTTKSTFTVSGDGHGAPCPGPRFSPGFTAGTQNPIAGGFSPFGMQLTRTDDDGEFSSLSSLSLPRGLLANVASITTRCTIEQADAHSCPADSHIGEVTAGAGAGSNPFYVGGDVYLTGSYEGNPFGVAVIVHALAGPFDLGYVVVKGAIQIHDDGSVTVATDPFPTILQGIPLQIRDIRVNLDRPGFTFNPTSCNPMSINGTVLSTANQQAGVSSRFQVGECASLAFKPRFSAATSGRTSKANGASFHVRLASNEGPHSTSSGGESNIAKVDVQLPVALPARLTTLQKACTAAQFASNPADCPQASFVGSATAHTPILASPLSGPAILVSHGGQAFPDLVLVLQGEGVRLNITGHTQIKKGITFSRFETVPDAPVASFDLTLPQGPHSALTTDVPGRNLCANTKTVTVTKRVTRRVHGHNRKVRIKARKAVATPLSMPTTITAQNGAVIHQNTKIAVTGCAAVKSKAKKKKGAKKGRR
jgi:hypothetical protein